MTDMMKLELDRRRVTLVLEINAELFRESIQIQKASEGDPEKARQDVTFIHCMKRLQCNLAYLAGVADRGKITHAPQYPQILIPPPDVATLVEPYKKLQELFRDTVTSLQSMQPVQQQQHQLQQQQQQLQNSPQVSQSHIPPQQVPGLQQQQYQLQLQQQLQQQQKLQQQQQLQQQQHNSNSSPLLRSFNSNSNDSTNNSCCNSISSSNTSCNKRDSCRINSNRKFNPCVIIWDYRTTVDMKYILNLVFYLGLVGLAYIVG
ncbi:hypothetical protein V1527DRAFT_3367 [Lipomyces starkeyi]